MKSSVIKRYVLASGVSLFSKVCVTLSGIGVLYILNQAMPKDVFGLYILAFTLCFLIANVVSGFFQSLILYYVSRDDTHTNIVSFSVTYAPIIAVACSILLFMSANLLSSLMHKSALSVLLSVFVWMIPAYVGNIVLTTRYRAQQNVPIMLVFQEILPATLKIVFLGACWFYDMPHVCFIWGMIISYALPCVLLYVYAPVPLSLSKPNISMWDFRYGLTISLNTILTKSSRNLVTVIIGFIASASVVADVSVAIRLAQFLLIPKLMLAQLHVPRIGKKLKEKDVTGVMQEFNVVRAVSLSLTLIGALIFTIFGTQLLALFGDYQYVYPLLMLLSVASIIRAGFGDIGGFLSMAGHAGAGVVANFVGVIVLFASLLVLVPEYFQNGVGVSLVLSAGASMTVIAFALKKYEGVVVVNLGALFVMVFSGCLLISVAFGLITFN